MPINFLPPTNEVWGKVMFSQVCVKNSVHGGGGVPACIAGGIPACLAVGLQGGVVSQHALQVSRPTPRGEVEGDLVRGISRPTPKGEVEGDLARGVSRPTPGGVCSWNGLLPRGGLVPGGAWSGGLCGDPSGMATAAGGTHPTGMHSCFYLIVTEFMAFLI